MTYFITRVFLVATLLICNNVLAQAAWEFQASGMLKASATVDDRIYIAGGKTVYALDFSGKPAWQRDLGADIAARVTVAGATLYVHSHKGVHALDKQGEPIWFFPKQDRGPLVAGKSWGWGDETLADPWGWYRSAPLVTNGRVYFGSDDGLYALSADSGAQLWHTAMGPVTTDPVAFEDSLIVGSWDNRLYSLKLETGEINWSLEAQTPRGPASQWIGYHGFNLNPVVYADEVYAGARGTYFYKLNAKTGEEAWSVKVGTSWIGSPALVTDETVYFGLSDGKAVLGYNRKGGEQNTFLKTGSLVFAQPQMYGDQLIIGTLSGRLLRADTKSGESEIVQTLTEETGSYNRYFDPKIQPAQMNRYQATQWSIDKMLSEFNAILNLAIHEDTVYLSTASGTLYAIPLDHGARPPELSGHTP
jgi:outer membrane protein assembly factor BamB